MQNIIVTGGAGYIGSHACKALKAAGYTPITIDNLITGWRDAVHLAHLNRSIYATAISLIQFWKNTNLPRSCILQHSLR